ncbi:hypothetical protein AARAC_011650 [Aspergillus arachidicola]|nr:hypothetical protein AARAC_011650 [Aspergillus arachidicola]
MAPGPTQMELCTPIRDLSDAVLRRLRINDTTVSCMVFSSGAAGHQCATVLKTLPSENPFTIEVVRFVMPLESNLGDTSSHWANFTAVLYPSDLLKAAMAFWRDTGSGLSTRHAEFCLEEFDYLDSDSSTPAYRTPASRKRCRGKTLESLIWIWLYPEIVDVVRRGTWAECLSYKYGTEEELDLLEALLQSSIVFHDPRTAEHFYNVFNVCKGSSFGTNFTLAIPYVQLANYWNQDKVAKHGVPRHIVRISVGLEDSRQIVETVKRALKSEDEFEMKKDLN